MKEQSRKDQFTQKIATSICLELPQEDNPYVAKSRHIMGYEQSALAAKYNFTDILYLQFRGELPTPEQSQLLSRLMVSISNLGPRHEASRAAMNAGIGRTNLNHIIPISLMVAAGKHNGSQSVFDSMRFIKSSIESEPQDILASLDPASEQSPHYQPIPGFGSLAGTQDPIAAGLIENIYQDIALGSYTSWVKQFAQECQQQPCPIGPLLSGATAAVLLDLGFNEKQGLFIFQLAIAPSLAAYGLEKFGQPLTQMPFLDESKYDIEC